MITPGINSLFPKHVSFSRALVELDLPVSWAGYPVGVSGCHFHVQRNKCLGFHVVATLQSFRGAHVELFSVQVPYPAIVNTSHVLVSVVRHSGKCGERGTWLARRGGGPVVQ